MNNQKVVKAVITLGVLIALALGGCGQVSDPNLTANGPDFPSGVSATPGNGRVFLAWTGVNSATSYNVYYSTVPGVNVLSGTLISTLSSNFYTHSTVTNGVKYYYVVTAVNSKGMSSESAEVSAMPLATLGRWTAKAPMGTAREGMASGAIGNSIYVINGWGATGTLSSVEAYNTITNVWSTVAPNLGNTAMSFQASSVIGTTMYLVGGVTSNNFVSNAVVQYTPSTNTWTTRANMPTSRSVLATCASTSFVFAIGGWNGTSVIGTVERYDTVANTWTTMAPMPTARRYITCSTVGSDIYIFGGRASNGADLATVERYNTGTNTWTTMAPMPTVRRGMTSTAIGTLIYVFGGYNANVNTVLDITEIYNTATNTWTSAESMLTARNVLTSSTVGGNIYAIGGYDGFNDVSTVEMFTP